MHNLQKPNFNFKQILTDPRQRTIFITIISAVILLAALILVVVNATKKPSTQFSNEESTTSVDIATVKEDTPAPVDNSGDAGTVEVPATAATNPAPVTTELPTTGPESILPLILLTTSATLYFASRQKSTE